MHYNLITLYNLRLYAQNFSKKDKYLKWKSRTELICLKIKYSSEQTSVLCDYLSPWVMEQINQGCLILTQSSIIHGRASVRLSSFYVYEKKLQFFSNHIYGYKRYRLSCPVQATKAYRGSTAPFNLNLCIRLRWEMNVTPWPFYPWNKPRWPLNRRLCGPQSRSGRFGEEKNLFPLAGFEPRTVKPVT
jgi:hypothetical protein